jgi:C1A family cysteine protease
MSVNETAGCLEMLEGSQGEDSTSLNGNAGHLGGSAGNIAGRSGQTGGQGAQPGVAPASTRDVAVLASNDVAGKAPGTGKPEGRGRRGCIPDVPDTRDVHYVPPVDTATLPESVDLRALCPPVYNQGNLGSCTANAIGAAIEYNQMQTGKQSFVPSRLFIYFNERVLEGTIKQDAGATIRNGIKTVVRLGAPPEDLWAYDESAVFTQPHPDAYAAAKLDLVTVYCRVGQTLPLLQACLMEGFPIVFRYTCFPSMDHTWDDGVIPMPGPTETSEDGHCMLIVGYNNANRTFLVRNSWGTQWGQQGYGTMPYDYILSPQWTTDLWTIRSVTERAAKPLSSAFSMPEEPSAPSASEGETGAGKRAF